ncbi:TAFII55 protein conserved region-domain-containing protein [Stachybotrys elegans]|uniref:TAFII55 protein conserved region-domain-containing protein n=1 Tax=Stachybotrys elegans TaxID=80388 RepID=A0A8K0T7N8_9HYPO|nr:TAFII55 protein conserved region-domain-containing protein [Stachybotrys elegans]
MSGPEPGAAPAKPRLKINISRSSSVVGDAATPSASASALPASAVTPSEGHRKLKLKVHSSQPPTPAEQPPVTTKAGRQPKPTQKLVESKKRQREEDLEDALHAAPSSKSSAHPHTKIKIRQTPKPGATQLVLKPRGRPPHHPPGDGYDSEASDRELDPAIEEQFILRMPPGEHCEYVRWCMENGKMGVHKSQGGADIALKFFEEDTRRAIMTVKGQPFAAVMVDLPTITESMKTWDKKSFMKSADICQMLLVIDKVKNEDEARHIALPPMIDPNFKWPHGLTPPMHDCVNRRFAKTISRKEIEDKEAEVERLLAEDAKAASTKWEWVDDRRQDADDEEMGDEDAEGEADDSYFAPRGDDDELFGDGDDLEADLEAAFADDMMVAETPATGMDMATPMATQAETPAAAAGGLHESIEADDESEDDDDDDDDDDDEDLDEDERAQRDEEQGVKDIIHDMEKQLAKSTADLEKTQNKILRERLERQIKQLRSEIELKKSSIGMETDD